jgi:hypothetical protein
MLILLMFSRFHCAREPIACAVKISVNGTTLLCLWGSALDKGQGLVPEIGPTSYYFLSKTSMTTRYSCFWKDMDEVNGSTVISETQNINWISEYKQDINFYV